LYINTAIMSGVQTRNQTGPQKRPLGEPKKPSPIIKPPPIEQDDIFLQLSTVIRDLYKGGITNVREDILKHHASQKSIEEFLFLSELNLNYLKYVGQSHVQTHGYAQLVSLSHNYDHAKELAKLSGNSLMTCDGVINWPINYIAGDISQHAMCDKNGDAELQTCYPVLKSCDVSDRKNIQEPNASEMEALKNQINKHYSDKSKIQLKATDLGYTNAATYIKEFRFHAQAPIIPSKDDKKLGDLRYFMLNLRKIVSKSNQSMLDVESTPLRQLNIVPIQFLSDSVCVCNLCGKECAMHTKQMDHFLPVVVAYILGVLDSPLNYAPTHSACNTHKGDKLPVLPRNDGEPPTYVYDNADIASYLKGTLEHVFSTFDQDNVKTAINALQKLIETDNILNKSDSTRHIRTNLIDAKSELQHILKPIIDMLHTAYGGGATTLRGQIARAQTARAQTLRAQTLVQPLRSVAQPLRSVAQPLRSVAQPLRSVAQPLRSVAQPLRSVAPLALNRRAVRAVPTALDSYRFFNKAIQDIIKGAKSSTRHDQDIMRILFYQQMRDYFEMVSQMKEDGKKASQSGGGTAFDAILEFHFSSQYGRVSKNYHSIDDKGKKTKLTAKWSPKDRTQFYKFRMLALDESSKIYYKNYYDEWSHYQQTLSYNEYLRYRIDMLIVYYVEGSAHIELLMH